jgi:multidrug efflux system outer membrane protein
LNQLIGQAPEAPLRVSSPIDHQHSALLRASGAASTPPPTVAASSQAVSEGAGSPIFSQRDALLSGLINRPDVIGAQATLEARRAQVDAIARQRLPQVELQLRRNAVFGEGDIAVRAVITAPIFDFGSIKNEKRAAQAEARAQQAHIALLKSQAASQIEQALILLEQRRATAEIYRSGIVPQTLELLRKTRIGFDAGASTYLEVLEAQRTLRSVQAEYLEALVGVRTSQIELERASGVTLLSTTSTSTTPTSTIPTSTPPAKNGLTPDASEGGVR